MLINVRLTSELSDLAVQWPPACLPVGSMPVQPKPLFCSVIGQFVFQLSVALLCGTDAEPPSAHHTVSEPGPNLHTFTDTVQKQKRHLHIVKPFGLMHS